MPDLDVDHQRMLAATRLAVRGHGGAEPNPPVGCLIVAEDGSTVGWGYHRHFGGPHAEVEALTRAGAQARGATAYVTLEPCNHDGKTPPCSAALIRAGVRRIVIGRRDPNPVAGGGLEALAEAGVETTLLKPIEPVMRITDPFARRVRSGQPWVLAKWAQTVDGRIATRTGDSQWISSPRSRRMVHRERARVDVILSGIGTVRADDPLLTARDVRVRRVARRVIVDPRLEIPGECRLLGSLGQAPLTLACGEEAAHGTRAAELSERGVEILGLPERNGALQLAALLRTMVDRHDATNVLVEAGPGLTGHLLTQQLVNEMWVFIGPTVIGDAEAAPPVSGRVVESLADAVTLSLRGVHQRSDDVVLRYGVASPRP